MRKNQLKIPILTLGILGLGIGVGNTPVWAEDGETITQFNPTLSATSLEPTEGKINLYLGAVDSSYKYGLTDIYVAGYDYKEGVTEEEADKYALNLGKEEDSSSWTGSLYMHQSLETPLALPNNMELVLEDMDLAVLNPTDVLYLAARYVNTRDAAAEEIWQRAKVDYRGCMHSEAGQAKLTAGEGSLVCKSGYNPEKQRYEYYEAESGRLSAEEYEKLMTWEEEYELLKAASNGAQNPGGGSGGSGGVTGGTGNGSQSASGGSYGTGNGGMGANSSQAPGSGSGASREPGEGIYSGNTMAVAAVSAPEQVAVVAVADNTVATTGENGGVTGTAPLGSMVGEPETYNVGADENEKPDDEANLNEEGLEEASDEEENKDEETEEIEVPALGERPNYYWVLIPLAVVAGGLILWGKKMLRKKR